MRGETVSFYLGSVGRNRFLQPFVGHFGGDGTATATSDAAPIDPRYAGSSVYRATVTDDPKEAEPRHPSAGWYAAGTASVVAVVASDGGGPPVVTLRWRIHRTVYNTLRNPTGQCITIAVGGGHRPRNVELQPETTRSRAVFRDDWDGWTGAARPTSVSYILRRRPPDATFGGPFRLGADGTLEFGSSTDAAVRWSLPRPGRDLVHLAVDGEFSDPWRARDRIYAVAAAVAADGPSHSRYRLTLSPPPPDACSAPAGFVEVSGYLEVWAHFDAVRRHGDGCGKNMQCRNATVAAPRRASVALSELILPRLAAVRRHGGTPVTALPFLWVYVRHRALRPVADAAVYAGRRMMMTPLASGRAAAAPPGWVYQRDTLCFLASVPAARINGSRFLSCVGAATVTVEVSDAPAAAVPEVCIVLPSSGEVLDLAEYGDGVPLPREIAPDENADVHCLLTVHFESSACG